MDDEDESRPTEAMAVPPAHEPSGVLPDIAFGTAIGDYIVDGELGRGGMGVVYSATHPVIGKRAAIKVLRSSGNPAAVERFMQEARAVNQIGHPNIVDIFDFAQLPDGRRYLVMDLLVGETLRARVKKGPLPVREACVVLDEVASALVAAHGKGFAHRDLKPDNVFLADHGGRLDVKLLDFGLAKLLRTSGLANERAFRTATGVQLGTPDYMSPEQLRADPNIDARTDIYAFGVVAFEILTGARPRRLSDGFDLTGTPAEVVGKVAGVTPELAQLVGAMMSFDPDDRPSLAAIRAVIKRLRPALAAAPAELPEATSAATSTATLPGPLPSPRPPTAPPPGATPPNATPVVRLPTTPPAGLPPPTAPPASALDPSGPTRPGIPRTRLGVEPAPAIPRRRPAAAPKRSSRLWWLVGVGAALAVGIALLLALG